MANSVGQACSEAVRPCGVPERVYTDECGMLSDAPAQAIMLIRTCPLCGVQYQNRAALRTHIASKRRQQAVQVKAWAGPGGQCH
eukprot:5723252-Pyramimonas_sp.AAC.1